MNFKKNTWYIVINNEPDQDHDVIYETFFIYVTKSGTRKMCYDILLYDDHIKNYEYSKNGFVEDSEDIEEISFDEIPNIFKKRLPPVEIAKYRMNN